LVILSILSGRCWTWIVEIGTWFLFY